MQWSLSTAESLAWWEEKMEFHLCVERTYQDLHCVSSKAPFHMLSLGSLVLIPTQLLKLSFKAPFRIRLECASCEQDRVRECCLQKALHGKHFRPWQSYIGFEKLFNCLRCVRSIASNTKQTCMAMFQEIFTYPLKSEFRVLFRLLNIFDLFNLLKYENHLRA